MLEVGAVHRPHGLKGAIIVYSHTRPAIGVAGYSFWWLGDSPASAVRYEVERCWQHGKRILAELHDVADVAAAEKLAGSKIWVRAEDVDIGEDEYLWQDLVGCEVVRQDGSPLGRVAALEAYGAQDILVVDTPENAPQPGEWLLPFIEEVVTGVDIEARRIEVCLPEGMDACFTPRF